MNSTSRPIRRFPTRSIAFRPNNRGFLTFGGAVTLMLLAMLAIGVWQICRHSVSTRSMNPLSPFYDLSADEGIPKFDPR